MALSLNDVSFVGPAMPAPFVLHKLEPLLAKKKLLAQFTKLAKLEFEEQWEAYYRKLRAMREQGLDRRVLHHVIEPLVPRLGYERLIESEEVSTREGLEPGGFLLTGPPGTSHLRAWVTPAGTDLDAPNKRGRAYRFSPALVAQRVLLTKGERIGLLTDGLELRIVLSDPSGRDSHLALDLRKSGGWRNSRKPPDSYRLLLALCQPAGVQAIGELLDEARLAQSGITKKLRQQARSAVEGFIQGLLDDPANRETHRDWKDLDLIAKQLWHEGLIFVYRLLFILKLESATDPARCFSFATVSTWRNSYSPSTALAPIVEKVRDEGAETGSFLEHSLRALFRMFSEGLSSSDLQVSPLGGMLFGNESTPLLDALAWSEKAVAKLLDALLWTAGDGKGKDAVGRERVHYGALDVEDLGRVYEALLELEPGVTREPMCRLRRAKLEVVVPLKDGAAYRKNVNNNEDGDEQDDEDEEEESSAKKTKVVFVEEIPKDRFFLRVGLGRKASGSYYTPHPFVRFLVQETLGPQIALRSPKEDPNPAAILELNVLDPAMGSGHFLVEACRFLGEALYEACRLCDGLALEAQRKSETTKKPESRAEHLERARVLWRRVENLPDPENELLAYLPSRILDGEENGLSQRKALALCRRLVAVHCLYGVDKNPLAVELARVSLWLESYAEGLPLTFLEHRLICGDSLAGPFFEHLLTFPGTGKPVEQLHSQGIADRLRSVLGDALGRVRDLEASIGKDVADLELKRIAKEELDRALQPLRELAAVWSGGVMLGDDCDDMGYEELLGAVSRAEETAPVFARRHGLVRMRETGAHGVPYDLAFPEVFHPEGSKERKGGFHAVFGNPPWDAVQPKAKEFYAAFDLRVLEAPTRRERTVVEKRVSSDPDVVRQWSEYQRDVEQKKRIFEWLCSRINQTAGGAPSGATLDVWQPFAERSIGLLALGGRTGLVLPSAFHANQSATGIRDLWLRHSKLETCYSFENERRKFFDIHASFKFAPVIAQRAERPTERFRCAFYLHEMDWLTTQEGALEYTTGFVEDTGGEYLTFMELRCEADAGVAARCFSGHLSFENFASSREIRLGRELHMTDDAHRFTPAGNALSDPRDPDVARTLLTQGYLPLHEGKTFHQFDDRWGDPPRYVVALSDVADKPAWTRPAQFYRVAFRAIRARRTNERQYYRCSLRACCSGIRLLANACLTRDRTLSRSLWLPWGMLMPSTGTCDRRAQPTLTSSSSTVVPSRS